jgi:hypothetical protein
LELSRLEVAAFHDRLDGVVDRLIVPEPHVVILDHQARGSFDPSGGAKATPLNQNGGKLTPRGE